MNHELICTWLSLPESGWPPNHYQLLGLKVGEDDISLIEERVHQRLDAVRRYQVMYPEQATEAMNRLAQAFICLTNPPAKKAYDEQLQVKPKSPPPPPPPPPRLPTKIPPLPNSVSVPELPREPIPPGSLVWLYTEGANGPSDIPPPPTRADRLGTDALNQASPPPPPPSIVEEVAVDVAPPVPPPPPEPVDPILELARSLRARRGLATHHGIQRRLAQVDALLALWESLGKYLDSPDVPLNKQAASELYKLAGKVEEATDGFPLLGQAGRPGYQIVSLTLLEKSRALLLLTPQQRESLQRDWQAGKKFLLEHRLLVQEEDTAFQRLSWFGRLGRFFTVSLDEQPLVLLILFMGLIALTIAAVLSW